MISFESDKRGLERRKIFGSNRNLLARVDQMPKWFAYVEIMWEEIML